MTSMRNGLFVQLIGLRIKSAKGIGIGGLGRLRTKRREPFTAQLLIKI